MACTGRLRSGIIFQGDITPVVPMRIRLTPQTTNPYSGSMRSIINTSGRGFWLLSALALLLVHSSQAYSPVHFHHDHDDHGHPFELNLHPVKTNPVHLAAHREDGHHHHSFKEHIAWYRVRPLSSGLQTLTDLSSLCTGPHSDPCARQKSTGWACDEALLPESIPIAPFDPRGPPA